MNRHSSHGLVRDEECNDCNRRELEHLATWMVFSVVWKTLRLLIIVVGLVLIIVALVAAGAADQVNDVLRYWPLIP